MKSYRVFRGLTGISAFLFFAVNGATIGMYNNAGYINRALGIKTSMMVKKDGGSKEIPTYYKSEFSSDINNYTEEDLAKKNKAAEEFIETEEEEGAVLLRNNNSVLPLTSEEIKNVSLFGATTVSPYYRSHSGGGSSQRIVSYLDALSERGFTYNPKLIEAYNNATLPERNYKSINEAPVSIYTSDVKDSFKSYNGAAIVIISREAGENDDLTTSYQDSDGTTHSILALNKNEKDMLNLVKEYKENGTFSKVIVLLNTSNTMEVDWLDDYDVDACAFIGGPGQSTGFYGVADLLKGDVSFSGKLVDTYAADSLSSPAMQNFGEIKTDNLIYAEDIYVGYKYYETRYEDCIMNRYNASCTKGTYASTSGWNYAQEVTFPFGYGLTYTNFTQTLEKVKDNGDNTITVTVKVKNKGNYKTKNVVEVYAQTPYGDYERTNLVEKSAIQLVGFAKTDDIDIGGEATVEVNVDKYFLASYDYKKLGGYYLSEGNYYLSIGSDAHDALNNILAKKGYSGLYDQNGKEVKGDTSKVYSWSEKFNSSAFEYSSNGTKVENQLEKADINYWKENSVTYLSRQDWDKTYPTKYLIECDDKMIEAKKDLQYTKPEDSTSSNDIKTEVDSGMMIADMWNVSLDAVDADGNNVWDKFIDQLSLDELVSLMTDQNAISAIDRIGFVGGGNSDGIDGVNVNCYIGENVAACSWSTSMLQRRGEFIGEDCLYKKVQFLWGPGANYHRTPFGGRNFEYYSEDSLIGYEMAAAQVKGSESKGVTVGIKHFFSNDQETRRSYFSTFSTEQAFREIYLRPFEGAFVKGGATATMTTNSLVGLQFVGQYEELIQNILHGEWGFYGIVITDAGGGYTSVSDFLNAGGNMFCFCGNADGVKKELRKAIINGDDGNLLKLLKNNAKEILYTYAHTNLMNGLTSDFYVVNLTPWWETAMIVVNIVGGVITLGCLTCFVLFSYVFKGKKSKKDEVTIQ